MMPMMEKEMIEIFIYSAIPVLVEKGHCRHRVEHLPGHGPAWSVDAVLWYFDRWETLTG